MTTTLWRTGLCAILAALCHEVHAADAPVPEAPEPIRVRIADEAARFDVPGIAVAAIRDGNVVWIETQGKATDARPIDRRTVFNAASLTKPMFATMVMHLTADDAFALDTPLARYWVDPDVADDPRHEQLTARLALSHQSGLPNWRGSNPLAFAFAPGARYENSGEGFEYVRRAVERATDRESAGLMAKYVTRAAGMTGTYYGWDDAIAGRLATGYREDGSALDRADVKQRRSSAAASTFTTIGDVARFAAWIARGADLPPDAFAEMLRPQAVHDDPAEYFSVGWRITTVNGTPVMSHDGREGGLRTLMIVDPDTRDGLVILTNSSNGELVTRGIVSAALPNGHALNAQTDRDIWHFMRSQPPQMQAGMLSFIARSPSFTAKLLYAVDTTLIEAAGLPAEESARVAAATGALVEAHHAGEIADDRLAAHLALLDGDESDAVSLVARFDARQARAWIESLRALVPDD